MGEGRAREEGEYRGILTPDNEKTRSRMKSVTCMNASSNGWILINWLNLESVWSTDNYRHHWLPSPIESDLIFSRNSPSLSPPRPCATPLRVCLDVGFWGSCRGKRRGASLRGFSAKNY
ncbi:hypothetical protein Trydic_g21229 [Trypoxylus dichotomus]